MAKNSMAKKRALKDRAGATNKKRAAKTKKKACALPDMVTDTEFSPTWLRDTMEKSLARKGQQAKAGWPPQGWEAPIAFPADPAPVTILEWLDHLTSGDRLRDPDMNKGDIEVEFEGKLVPLDFLQNQPGGRKKGKGNALARDVYRLVHHLEDAHGWDNAPQEEMGVVYSYHEVRTLIRTVIPWIRTHDKPPRQSPKSTREQRAQDRDEPTWEQLETLRKTIAERGSKTSPDTVRRHLRTKGWGMKRSRMLRGLRKLESLGAYSGFTRPSKKKP